MNQNFFAATAALKMPSTSMYRGIMNLALALLVFTMITSEAFGQNLITVPFTNGFVGLNTGNNSAGTCYYFSGAQGLGWTNIQFAQNSPTNIFVAQGNDIIGSVLITDFNGVEYEIPGFIKWRTPSGGSPSTMVFTPNVGSSFTLTTNGFNGASTYTITDGNYIGLTFNGQTLTITPVPGTVTGNAATNGLLDTLNAYLGSFADMSVSDATVNEGAGTVTITVTISTTVTGTVTVNYATSNGTATAGLDYTNTSGTLTFLSGVTSQSFTVPITNDILLESSENFTVTLTDPVNVSLLDPIGSVTIIDNDAAVEICNGVDDDGDGLIDEGVLLTFYADTDGDGFGNPSSNIQACSAPSGYVSNNTDCNDASALINPNTVWYLDVDGDGYYVSSSISCTSPGSGYNTTGGVNGDCNDNNAAVNAAATEVCNGIDDNCNGQIDEGVLLTFYADADGDGFGDESSSVQACSQPTGYVSNNTDCNDSNALINPNTVWYLDVDGDGYYVSTSTSCTSPGSGYNTTGGVNGDCNDNNAAVNAAATEVCNGIDDNCNALIDDGVVFVTYYADEDGDGFGGTTSVVACVQPEGYVTDNTDCNDASATVYPGATEICNTIDDNCNGQIDEGVLLTFYADADGDGFGDAESTTLACTAPEGYVTDNTDCDDASATVYPGATEICNTIDDNCNGQIDEGVLLTFYADADGDGFGDDSSSVQACSQPTGYVSNNTDCNDSNALINPNTVWYLDVDGDGYYVSTSTSCTSPGSGYNTTGGVNGDCNDNNAAVNAAATEVCNGIDDNCNGQIDEGVLLTFYADADGDGFGDAESTTLACTAPEGYVTDNTDCNDASATVYPGATEICNTIDDNCNGQIDEGVLLTFYADADGDGFGDAESTTLACTAPEGYVTDNTDCNDASATVYPGATEQCNGIDDNCNTLIDDGVVFVTYYADEDGDGFGGTTSVVACVQPEGYVTDNTDCNDASATVYPGATEICNTIDDNCNGQIDEGVLLTFYADADGDGFGDAESTTLACTTPEGYVTDNTDCNDASATVYPGATEVCNGIDDNCNGQIDEGVLLTFYADADVDGFGDAGSTTLACTAPEGYVTDNTDCDDASATVYPGATEICNTIDDNCNGQIDEGVLLTFYADTDGDGFGDTESTTLACTAPEGYVTDNTDCNDASATVYPGATEICNTIDDNCNGQIDEGVLLTFYADADGDGFGDAESTTLACTAPEGFVTDNTDCDDASATVYPGATEQCNGIDDNCNTLIDDGVVFVTYYADEDGDGFGGTTSVVACVQPEGYVTDNTDCNDASATVYPGATEICNTIDDNCNGQIDEGVLLTFYADADGDGFGDAESTTLACTAPEGFVTDNTDCNDASATVYPGATEICNTIDDNCNGQIDEGVLLTFYADADGDGFGDDSSSVQACSQPTGYVSNNTDCNDSNALINPNTVWYLDVDGDGYYVSTSTSCTSPGSGYNTTGGVNGDCNDNNAAVNAAATEVCNGIDDNCNGQIDEGVLLTFYADADGDGFGDAESTTLACTAPEGYVTDNTDCNDASATVYPGATEICNTIDDNCNGQIDEGVLLTFYADADGDGFGDAESTTLACTAPEGYVTDNTDCNDASATVYPGATEQCNGIDDNCNTLIDDGVVFVTYYADEDGDGFGGTTSVVACVQPEGYVTDNTDCNDASATVYPGATEICNTIDDNCNGQIDEGVLLTFYADADGDGFGDAESTTLACTTPEGYVTDNTDCNDASATVYPGATEICNTIDDNCNGQIDEGVLLTFYADADGDGFGDAESTTLACTAPEGYVTDNTDCNDASATVYPGATEICNTIDDNCNGQIDEGVLLTFYADADGDGFGDTESTTLACTAPEGYVTDNTDCNDASATVYPGATEICNTIDDNCNGQIDEGVLLTFYADADGDGFGDAESTTLACTAPEGFVTDNTDCDDASATVYPGATEQCNGIDDNCNTLIDDGVVFVTYYADEDGDGFGGTTSVVACVQPEGYVTDNTDCNDASATVYPGATEICNTIDDNCNGQIDEGVLLTFYADADGDGFGDAGSSVQACTAPEGYVTDNTDCDDTDALNDSNSAPFAANTEITIETHQGNTSIALAELVSDVDGDVLNFTVVENANVSLMGSDLNVTWSADFVGTLSLAYVVCDQGGNACDPGVECDTAVVTVYVYNGNPLATNDAAFTNEDESVTVSVTDNDNDADGSIDVTTVDLDPNTDGIQTGFASANGQWSVDGNGQLTFIPNSNFNGVDSLNYVVQDNDGLFSNEATVVITVNAINDQVQANDDSANAVEGSTSIIDVASNDTDTDGIVDLNTIEIITLPSHGNASVNENGQIEFIPNPNFDGLDSLAYVICDNGLPLPAQCDTAWVYITINSCVSNPANDCDNDGLTNEEEENNGTDPLNPDSDGDGVVDGTELVDNTNPIDPCNLVLTSVSVIPSEAWYALDCDGDSIPNGEENGTDPLNEDTDGDGVSDSDEIQDGTNPNDPCNLILASVTLTPSLEWYTLDCDGDSIPNGEENGTDPLNEDTDGDGVSDSDEIQDGTNPNDPCSLILASVTLTPSLEWYTLDCDGDSIPNGEENGTDPLNEDTDGDGVSDSDEVQDGTNPNDPCSLILASVTLTPSTDWFTLDCDGDSIPNGEESGTNPLSQDTDGDGVTDSDELQDVTNPLDPCSLILASVTLTPSPEWYTLDCDGDSIPNGEENGTDPLNPDTDGDGVTDADEIQDGTDPTNPCEFLPESITVQVDSSWFEVDCDNDGLTNAEELIGNLEWNDPDTDGDGVLDGTEIVDGTNPLDPCSLIVASITLTPEFDWIALDCDNDGLDNGAELSNNTNPLNPDTDGDGVTDGAEVGDITNPLDPCEFVVSSVTLSPSANWYALDCDGDSLSNGEELVNNTDVFNPDTDGDGVTDGTEVADNTTPTDPCSLVLTSISLTPIASWVDLDCDNDDLTNGDEVAYNTDPFNPDTDGDGVADGVEVADATVPTDPCSLTFASITLEPSIAWGDLDCDGDSVTNAEELIGGIDPFNPDTDGDGVTDGTEALDGTNPLDPCSYVFTSQTLNPSTEWENLDCDGDGLTNLEEANGGSDPNDPCSPVPCDIMIPQAITPNGDGFNDVLIINGIENYPDHELIIFNRWGAEVFRATAYQNDWNGNSQSNLNVGGDELPSGTYYYLFDTKVEGNEVMKGFIYLKR